MFLIAAAPAESPFSSLIENEFKYFKAEALYIG